MPTVPNITDNPDNLIHTNTNKTLEEYILQSYEDFRDRLYLIGSESISEEQLSLLYNSFVHITCAGKTVSIPFDATIYNILVSLIETMIKEF